jgi:hypothetical protein
MRDLEHLGHRAHGHPGRIGARNRLLRSGSFDQLLGRQADVFRDLTEESRRDVPTAVKGQCGLATVGEAVLPMRAALAHQLESESLEKALDLP